MVDTWWVVTNGLWVVGMSATLATLSWGAWQAERADQEWRAVLGSPPLRWGLNVGVMLFCLGLTLAARSWVQRGVWGVLAIVWITQALTGRNDNCGRK